MMTAGPPMVQLQGITKAFAGVVACENVLMAAPAALGSPYFRAER